jgi:hypothetical protein
MLRMSYCRAVCHACHIAVRYATHVILPCGMPRMLYCRAVCIACHIAVWYATHVLLPCGMPRMSYCRAVCHACYITSESFDGENIGFQLIGFRDTVPTPQDRWVQNQTYIIGQRKRDQAGPSQWAPNKWEHVSHQATPGSGRCDGWKVPRHLTRTTQQWAPCTPQSQGRQMVHARKRERTA